MDYSKAIVFVRTVLVLDYSKSHKRKRKRMHGKGRGECWHKKDGGEGRRR